MSQKVCRKERGATSVFATDGAVLMVARIGLVLVLGAPGCARSPKENGFDWVLQRVLIDISITGDDIRNMGAGGLLMEITSGPQPRDGSGR